MAPFAGSGAAEKGVGGWPWIRGATKGLRRDVRVRRGRECGRAGCRRSGGDGSGERPTAAGDRVEVWPGARSGGRLHARASASMVGRQRRSIRGGGATQPAGVRGGAGDERPKPRGVPRPVPFSPAPRGGCGPRPQCRPVDPGLVRAQGQSHLPLSNGALELEPGRAPKDAHPAEALLETTPTPVGNGRPVKAREKKEEKRCGVHRVAYMMPLLH